MSTDLSNGKRFGISAERNEMIAPFLIHTDKEYPAQVYAALKEAHAALFGIESPYYKAGNQQTTTKLMRVLDEMKGSLPYSPPCNTNQEDVSLDDGVTYRQPIWDIFTKAISQMDIIEGMSQPQTQVECAIFFKTMLEKKSEKNILEEEFKEFRSRLEARKVHLEFYAWPSNGQPASSEAFQFYLREGLLSLHASLLLNNFLRSLIKKIQVVVEV